ncbi:hypothetical protein MYCO108962_24345 [Mycobacterium colombiense]|uniref:Uncharacterized protein n=1 Tax=Mycobacterium colombiense CECT 3035 TaxID=1041522 RepID=J5EGQ9_9MYCO|nr:hypothetical protein [Mycobacterium colombiense]EJO88999.1 hypothetical protein MCOL_V212155 [Mycobacterium colombiense CECT 3035]MCK8643595.1 hypothetical protein [Mycobacterium colombiense]
MDADNNLRVDSGGAGAAAFGRPDGGRRRNSRTWINWGLALATVPAAAIVMLFALGAVMSTDGCSDRSCPNLGHGGIDFGVAFYGAPAVAVVVIVISFFTAKRRGGIAVPLCGWALLVIDVALMAASVAG